MASAFPVDGQTLVRNRRKGLVEFNAVSCLDALARQLNLVLGFRLPSVRRAVGLGALIRAV